MVWFLSILVSLAVVLSIWNRCISWRARRALASLSDAELLARIEVLLQDPQAPSERCATIRALVARGDYDAVAAELRRSPPWYPGPLGGSPEQDMLEMGRAAENNLALEHTIAVIAHRARR